MRSCHAMRGELSRGFELRAGIIEILPAARDSILDNGPVKKESSHVLESYFCQYTVPAHLFSLLVVLPATNKFVPSLFYSCPHFENLIVFFSDTRSLQTAFWITPRTMRSLGVKEVESGKTKLAILVTLRLSASPLFILVCLFFLWYFSEKFVIFLPLGAWRTSQDMGNMHVAMEFYLAEHFRPLTPTHHRAPSFTSFNCIIAPLCELGGGPVKGQSRWGRPFEVKKNAERAPSMKRFSEPGRNYLRRLRFLVAGQYDN